MKTRKQHIVPQTHLKNFSYKNKKTNKVIVLDKDRDELYVRGIDDVACKRDFYETEDKMPNYWEYYYGKIEDNIQKIYDTIIINSRFACNNDKVLSEYLKNELALIIISQLLRTEVSKKYFTNIGIKVTNNYIDYIKELYNDVLSNEQNNVLNKYRTNEKFVYSVALDCWNSKSFIKKAIGVLMDKVWIVHKNLNYESMPFVTSDNPVLLYNYYTKKFGFLNNGLMRQETIIYYPINKELLVAIYPNFNGLINSKNTIDFLNDNQFIMRLNKSNYDQCARQVFYSFDL